MRAVLRLFVITTFLAASVLAQKSATAAKATHRVTDKDVQELKDALAAQQQQIQTLQQQLQATNQQLQQTSQQYRQTQQQLQEAQQTATDAQQRAVSLESGFASRDTVDKLSSQFSDLQT